MCKTDEDIPTAYKRSQVQPSIDSGGGKHLLFD